VVELFTKLLRAYGVTEVVGDGYSQAWVETAFSNKGVAYKRSELRKTTLYLESLPLFTRGVISIPDFAPLVRELRLLERATHRGGKDTIDHPKRGSDDFANAVCGCAAMANASGYDWSGSWISGPDPVPEDPKAVRQRREKLVELLLSGKEIQRVYRLVPTSHHWPYSPD
jgi:hypothetical protein